MQLAEAVLGREEAIRLAAEELRRMIERNARYYLKAPAWRPDPRRPLEAAIRADDAWYYVPFARRGEGLEPITVRVNGLTKVVVIDRSV